VSGPLFVTFFFALQAMAKEVPSFATGGTLWCVDLSIIV
jgi:hypothetical protein